GRIWLPGPEPSSLPAGTCSSFSWITGSTVPPLAVRGTTGPPSGRVQRPDRRPRTPERGRPVGRPPSGRCAGGSGLRAEVALLLDARGLAAKLAEVVKLGTAHVTARDDLDRLDDGRVHGERTLDADAEGDLADRERLADAAV